MTTAPTNKATDRLEPGLMTRSCVPPQGHLPGSESPLVLLVLVQGLTEVVGQQRGDDDGEQRGGDPHGQQFEIADAVAGLHLPRHVDDGRRDRGGGDRDLGGDDGHRQRTRRTHSAFLGDLRDHGQRREGRVPGARHQRHGVGDERCVQGDALGVLAQHLLGPRNQIVHAAGGLHGTDGRDDGHDDPDDVEGDVLRPFGGQPQGPQPQDTQSPGDCLRASGTALTAEELGERVGLARVSARRYADYLVDVGQAVREPQRTGQAGRPLLRYRWYTEDPSASRGTPPTAS